jgi:hypothetical protein
MLSRGVVIPPESTAAEENESILSCAVICTAKRELYGESATD